MENSLKEEGLSSFVTLGQAVCKVVERLAPKRVLHGFYTEEVNEFDFVLEMEGL